MTAPMSPQEIAAVERMLKRHPGMRVVWHPADTALLTGRFQVAFDAPGYFAAPDVKDGLVYADGPTLQAAYAKAIARRDEIAGILAQREAA